jgi:hypothetical protein
LGTRLAGGMDRGRAVSRDAVAPVGLYAQARQAVDGSLGPSATATRAERAAWCISLQQEWESSAAPVAQHFAKRMRGVAPGWFVGGETAEFPADNWALERWCKGPQGHARRSHGHCHAGVWIVRQGPTLRLALDAHGHHHGPCTVDALEPYGHARVPESQQQAVDRGKMMRQARSRKTRSVLLTDLEKRYLNAP